MATVITTRKGQIQMFETIAVLIIFFFLIAFGLSFYFLISKAQAGKDYERELQLQTIVLSQKISTIPELDCIRVGEQVERCFDKAKIANFTWLLNNNATLREQYYTVFRNTNVTIEEIYPNRHTYQLYNNKLANATSVIPSVIPVLIQDSAKNTYSFGILKVRIYA